MDTRRSRGEQGFTLTELLAVLLVLVTLIIIAIPVYLSARGVAEKRACFQNQSTLARQAELYLAGHEDAQRADLAGLVTGYHPLLVDSALRTPRCPAGMDPVDPGNLTIQEGAYQFDASGALMGCTLGSVGPHGLFTDQ